MVELQRRRRDSGPREREPLIPAAGVLILGIDPGSLHTGWAIVETKGGSCRLLDSGRFSLPPDQPLSRRLGDLSHELDALLARWTPEVAAIESAFHGRNSKSLIVLAQARGAILARCGSRRLEVQEYSPAEVKIAVAGNGRADTAQVARMVELLLSLEPGGRSADQTDAMAVAVCFAKRYRIDRLRVSSGDRKAL